MGTAEAPQRCGRQAGFMSHGLRDSKGRMRFGPVAWVWNSLQLGPGVPLMSFWSSPPRSIQTACPRRSDPPCTSPPLASAGVALRRRGSCSGCQRGRPPRGAPMEAGCRGASPPAPSEGAPTRLLFRTPCASSPQRRASNFLVLLLVGSLTRSSQTGPGHTPWEPMDTGFNPGSALAHTVPQPRPHCFVLIRAPQMGEEEESSPASTGN